MERVSGWSEDGGTSVVITGTPGSGTQRFQQSFRGATVTVYAAGTTTLSTIYDDDAASPTAKANPFTANATTGRWFFFAAPGVYDIKFSGGGITSPFTIGSVTIGAGGTGVPSYAFASLPTSKTQNAGNLARVTNLTRGLWMDTGTLWFSTQGRVCDVREFGAVGDGTTDDSTAIQAAIDAAATSTVRGTVWFPPGTYRIVTALRIGLPGLRMCGSSSYRDATGAGSVLLSGTTGMTMLNLNPTTPTYLEGVEVSSLVLNCNSAGTRAAIGMQIRNTHLSRLLDIRITGASSIGLDVQDEIYDLYGEVIDITSCQVGASFTNPNGASLQKTSFKHLRCYGSTAENLLINHNGADMTFICYSGEQGTKGAAITGAGTNITFINPYFERNTTADMHFYKPSASSTTMAVNGCVIINPAFYGQSVSPYAILCTGAYGINIIGGYSQNHVTGTLEFNNTGLTNAVNVNCVANNLMISGETAVVTSDGLARVEFSTSSSVEGPSYATLFTAAAGISLNPIPTAGNVLSGTWTPTLTNTTNVAASTAYLCMYTRVGDVVSFSGRVDIDPTAAGGAATVLTLSVPINSAFVAAENASGVVGWDGASGMSGRIGAGAANQITINFLSTDTVNRAVGFIGQYRVL